MTVDGSERPSERLRPAIRLPYTIGDYTLFDFIGKGGMAEIYLGRTTSELGASRLCVVKIVLPEFTNHRDFVEMLTREAKLAARLAHANVVQIYELERDADGRMFIAMEYVEGFDLNALLRRCSRQKVPLPMEFAIYIVISALRGLDHAHRRTDDAGKPLGIVHRDVSPSNLLISFDGEVKVCDFGIAAANDLVSEKDTGDEAIKGKAGYMSPEHARGEVIDARSDVFALGIVLWELLAGRRLYRQTGQTGEPATRTSLLDQARKAQIPRLPPRSLPRERELYAIVGRALAREKSERYPSAAAMLRDLEAYAVGAGRMASPLKLGAWLSTHFGGEVIAGRRTRERAAAALARGPLVVLTPLAPAPPPSVPSPRPSTPRGSVPAPISSRPMVPSGPPAQSPLAATFPEGIPVSSCPVARSITPAVLALQPSLSPPPLEIPPHAPPPQFDDPDRTVPSKNAPMSSMASISGAVIMGDPAVEAPRRGAGGWILGLLLGLAVLGIGAFLVLHFGLLEPLLRMK